MKKTIMAAIILVAISGAASAGQAKDCAIYLDGPKQTYAIEQNHVVDVCTLGGEKIQSLVVGHSLSWQSHVDEDRQGFFLLPHLVNDMTNVIIKVGNGGAGEKRYELRLVAITPEPRVGKLVTGAEPGNRCPGVSKQQSSNTYKVITAPVPSFTPVNVWNDGEFTFIELKKPFHGELPVVFALADDGSRSLVNFEWDEQNSRFVVQRLLARAVLVLGDKSVVVSRT